jgi:hypothetical protein
MPHFEFIVVERAASPASFPPISGVGFGARRENGTERPMLVVTAAILRVEGR